MADQRSSSSFSFTYDVFLSFRCGRTDSRFTHRLLQGLRVRGIYTFIEDKKQPKGVEIPRKIVKAIEESRIAIIVLSKNYVASSFYLEELTSILDNFDRRNHRLIIPVCYGVDPSDLRDQRGTCGQAFKRHEEKFKVNNQKVQKWRNALHRVTELAGLRFSQYGDEYEFQFIGNIVEDVSNHIGFVSLHVADHPVGLESRLKEVCSLLELKSNEVLMVGIHAVGGIGKTTLSRAVYNLIAPRFEASCFLSDVTENSKIHGLARLQNMLLFDMIGEKDNQLGNADKETSIIKDRLYQKKVLLILDDVNTPEQLECLAGGLDWFGPGSRIIITTRDRNLLKFHGVERTYEVQPLNHQDSLQLLSHWVFKQGNFDPRHTEILNKFVSYASGLPLALEVIGIYLFGKTEDKWKKALHRFKRIPLEEIQMTLQTSFDALREDEKSVFLDIACCFKGYEMAKALDILCAHRGYNVKSHIEVLIDKSLVSISPDGKVILHPLIEDMGKEIVRRESPQEPWKRSRLWFPEDIIQVLKNNAGTSNIEIIHLDSSLVEEAIKWNGKAFKKMKNLRTLVIRCHLSKAPKYLPNSLRVLELWLYPSQKLPSDFNPKQLVIRNLLAELPESSPSDTEASHISPSVTEETPLNDTQSSQTESNAGVTLKMNDIEASHISPSVTEETPLNDTQSSQTPLNDTKSSQTERNAGIRLKMDFKKWMILVFVATNIAGLSCNAKSPHFKSSIPGWTVVKFFPFVVFFLAVVAVIRHIYWRQTISGLIKCCICHGIFLFFAVYSYFYERAVDEKVGTLSLVSNAMFALASLSLSKLFEAGFETGIFNYFLQCFIIQLLTTHWWLIFVAIFIGVPLFDWHFSAELFLLTGITKWLGTIRRWFGTTPLRNRND